MRFAMGRRQGYPQAGTAGRYGGRSDGGDQDPASAQGGGECEGARAVADQDGLDRRGAEHKVQAESRRAPAESLDQSVQKLTAPAFLTDELQGGEGGAGHAGGWLVV